MLTQISIKGKLIIPKTKRLLTKKGFVTDYTSKFHLCIKAEKEWIGEDILTHKPQHFPYSVVARSIVRAYEVDKADFLRLPSQYLQSLKA